MAAVTIPPSPRISVNLRSKAAVAVTIPPSPPSSATPTVPPTSPDPSTPTTSDAPLTTASSDACSPFDCVKVFHGHSAFVFCINFNPPSNLIIFGRHLSPNRRRHTGERTSEEVSLILFSSQFEILEVSSMAARVEGGNGGDGVGGGRIAGETEAGRELERGGGGVRGDEGGGVGGPGFAEDAEGGERQREVRGCYELCDGEVFVEVSKDPLIMIG